MKKQITSNKDFSFELFFCCSFLFLSFFLRATSFSSPSEEPVHQVTIAEYQTFLSIVEQDPLLLEKHALLPNQEGSSSEIITEDPQEEASSPVLGVNLFAVFAYFSWWQAGCPGDIQEVKRLLAALDEMIASLKSNDELPDDLEDLAMLLFLDEEIPITRQEWMATSPSRGIVFRKELPMMGAPAPSGRMGETPLKSEVPKGNDNNPLAAATASSSSSSNVLEQEAAAVESLSSGNLSSQWINFSPFSEAPPLSLPEETFLTAATRKESPGSSPQEKSFRTKKRPSQKRPSQKREVSFSFKPQDDFLVNSFSVKREAPSGEKSGSAQHFNILASLMAQDDIGLNLGDRLESGEHNNEKWSELIRQQGFAFQQEERFSYMRSSYLSFASTEKGFFGEGNDSFYSNASFLFEQLYGPDPTEAQREACNELESSVFQWVQALKDIDCIAEKKSNLFGYQIFSAEQQEAEEERVRQKLEKNFEKNLFSIGQERMSSFRRRASSILSTMSGAWSRRSSTISNFQEEEEESPFLSAEQESEELEMVREALIDCPSEVETFQRQKEHWEHFMSLLREHYGEVLMNHPKVLKKISEVKKEIDKNSLMKEDEMIPGIYRQIILEELTELKRKELEESALTAARNLLNQESKVMEASDEKNDWEERIKSRSRFQRWFSKDTDRAELEIDKMNLKNAAIELVQEKKKLRQEFGTYYATIVRSLKQREELQPLIERLTIIPLSLEKGASLLTIREELIHALQQQSDYLSELRRLRKRKAVDLLKIVVGRERARTRESYKVSIQEVIGEKKDLSQEIKKLISDYFKAGGSRWELHKLKRQKIPRETL